jgi:hypothetical protein
VKQGDLIRDRMTGRIGVIERIDIDYFGAGQSFKHLGRPRGQCVDSTVADIIAPTKHGKQDRVLVCWTDGHPTYEYSKKLEVINETG